MGMQVTKILEGDLDQKTKERAAAMNPTR